MWSRTFTLLGTSWIMPITIAASCHDTASYMSHTSNHQKRSAGLCAGSEHGVVKATASFTIALDQLGAGQIRQCVFQWHFLCDCIAAGTAQQQWAAYVRSIVVHTSGAGLACCDARVYVCMFLLSCAPA